MEKLTKTKKTKTKVPDSLVLCYNLLMTLIILL